MVLPVKAQDHPAEEPAVSREERADGAAVVSRVPVTPKPQKPIVEKKNA
jgi:hypothetical protein